MTSAAEVFINMFSNKPVSLRPVKAEGIIVAILHVLTKHDLLDEAVSSITALTDLHLENPKGLAYVKAVTASAEMVGLYNKDKAIQLVLKLLPSIAITEKYSKVLLPMEDVKFIINRKNKSHIYAELKKALKDINSLGLGYKIIQPPKASMNEFHIIKYKGVQDMLNILKEYGLQTPSILDKVLP